MERKEGRRKKYNKTRKQKDKDKQKYNAVENILRIQQFND